MKRLVVSSSAAAVLLIALASCGHEPPSYDSTYQQPPAPTTSRPYTPSDAEAPRASFVDEFERPNTELGLGEDWDMRGGYVGAYPLPSASDGFISDGKFTYAGDSIVCAVRQLRGAVQRVGAVGQWTRTRDGAESALAMAITPNDQLIADMVNFVATRSTWSLTVRRDNGAFENLASGKFWPHLDMDHRYRFEVEATDSAVTVRVPGTEVTLFAAIAGLLGDRAFWQEYHDPEGPPAGAVFEFDTVWAAEQGQPQFPVAI